MLLVVLGLALGGPLPGQVDADSPHYELEVAYSAADGLPELTALQERVETALRASPTDADLYWMKARLLFERGELLAQAGGDLLAHWQSMADVAEQGLTRRPGDPHLRFAHGIALARVGTEKGVLSSLFLARQIEADWLAATEGQYASLEQEEVLPADAYHALGVFYRLVPDWWIVQVLAGTRGDLDRSLEMHQKAASMRAGVETLKELGATQLCIAVQRDDAEMLAAGKATMQRATELPAHSEKHRIDQRHARELAADPSLACGYSRDGQQELDRAALKEP